MIAFCVSRTLFRTPYNVLLIARAYELFIASLQPRPSLAHTPVLLTFVRAHARMLFDLCTVLSLQFISCVCLLPLVVIIAHTDPRRVWQQAQQPRRPGRRMRRVVGAVCGGQQAGGPAAALPRSQSACLGSAGVCG